VRESTTELAHTGSFDQGGKKNPKTKQSNVGLGAHSLRIWERKTPNHVSVVHLEQSSAFN